MTSVENEDDMKQLGHELGSRLRGGEVVELVGDVGAGKTTFVKGIGSGLKVDDDIQSPSFTISRVYPTRDGMTLNHYDFYRLNDAGIMRYELAESIDDASSITVVEWADSVDDVLPAERIRIELTYEPTGDGRTVIVTIPGGLEYLSEAKT